MFKISRFKLSIILITLFAINVWSQKPRDDKDDAWEEKYEEVLKKDPSIRAKVESGGATKEDIITWLKWIEREGKGEDGKSDRKSKKMDAGQSDGKRKSAVKRHNFPDTAYEYAKLVEPELGVPPKVDLSKAIEIPLYVNGIKTLGELEICDNPTLLGKGVTMSGSMIQRYEGRTAEGKPLPDVVWVAFARHAMEDFLGSVQMIGYHKKTGATAFFESCDALEPWVEADQETTRLTGVMPWIDDPEAFNRAYRVPGEVQCVQCHQNEPFITDSFINAAKIPNADGSASEEPVIPILDQDAPYYVIGGESWDMRTIHIEGNACFDCHRVGMATVELFMSSGWDVNEHMPPNDPGSLQEDFEELMRAWRRGPETVPNANWIIPPARGKEQQVVGDDYPHKASFNRPRSYWKK
ncbi:MAG: hypothetical protein AAGG48_23965 [Planctomycetota bacterium]